jgi:hypothetical protein
MPRRSYTDRWDASRWEHDRTVNRLRAASTEYVVRDADGCVVMVYRKRGSAIVYCNDHDGCVFELRRVSPAPSKD